MNRLSQKEVEHLLNTVQLYSADGLNKSQCTAYNYLVDYVELGYNGINASHEGDRLFNLCIHILTMFLLDHGQQPKYITDNDI